MRGVDGVVEPALLDREQAGSRLGREVVDDATDLEAVGRAGEVDDEKDGGGSATAACSSWISARSQASWRDCARGMTAKVWMTARLRNGHGVPISARQADGWDALS